MERHGARPVAVQAHRGSPDLAAGIAENTVGAFLRAGRLGADGVELDVRRTADGALAVHHDPVVEGLGPVAGLRVRQLPDHVPLLPAALDACGELVVNIEVKNLPTEPGHDPDETAARMVAALVVEAGLTDRVVVSSFWPATLAAVSEADAAAPTALLLAGWADAGWGLGQARELGCRSLHPHQSLVTTDLVDTAHRVGLAVAAWTVNGGAAVAGMVGLGVDTVITDDVGSAVEALEVSSAGVVDPAGTAGHQGV